MVISETDKLIEQLAKGAYNKFAQSYGNLYGVNNDAFAHLVLSHGFMQFYLIDIEPRVYFGAKGQSKRDAYNRFCEINEVPEDVRELGWRTYLED